MSESLSSMNPKQLAKEYKTVAKNIKNKDDAVKLAALEKLHEDARYMTEGGCILPLLEIIQPKKKTLDFSCVALEHLLKFLKAPQQSGPVSEGTEATSAIPISSAKPASDILNSLYTLPHGDAQDASPASLDALQVLADLIIYRDEIKKSKPVKLKKGESPPPMVKVYDSDVSISLRNGGTEALYLLVQALKGTEVQGNSVDLAVAFAKVPNIVINLCQKVCDVASLLAPASLAAKAAELDEGVDAVVEPGVEQEAETAEDLARQQKSRDIALQEGEWALDCLALMLKYSASACQTLLNSPVLAHLPPLSGAHANFVQPILLIIDALAQQCNVADGEINGLVTIANPTYFNVLLNVVESSTTVLTQEAPKQEVAAPAPVPTKGGKGAPAPVATPEVDNNALEKEKENKIRSLLYMNTIVLTLTHVAKEQREKRQTGNDLQIITSENVPPLLNCLYSAVASDIVWSLLRSSVSLHSFVDNVCVLIGQIALAAPDLRTCVCDNGAVSVLMNILQSSASIKAEVGDSLFSLRRVCEQALLRLLTREGSCSENNSRESRWISCNSFSTDEAYFSTTFTTKVGDSTATQARAAQFMAGLELLLTDSDTDADLPDRAARVLASITSSSSDPIKFLRDSLCVSAKVSSLLASCALRCGRAVVSAAEASPVAGIVSDNAALAGLLVPSASEALYHNLSVLEAIVAVSPAHLQAFVSEANFKQLSDVVFATGPTRKGDTSEQLVQELSVALHDPRQDFHNSKPPVAELQLLRPLVLELFAVVCDQGGANSSTGISVCRLCSSACAATLSLDIRHDVQHESKTVAIKPTDGTVLNVAVLNAGLRCLRAMAETGREGLVAMLAALSSATGSERGALSAFATALGEAAVQVGSVPDRSNPPGSDATEAFVSVRDVWLKNKESAWSVPAAFSDILIVDEIPTTIASLAQRPVLWPFVTLITPVIDVLANPRHVSTSVDLAVLAAQALCCQTHGVDQHDFVYDICDAVFVGLGGNVALLSAASPFGRLVTRRTEGIRLADFLARRGSVYNSETSDEAASGQASVEGIVSPHLGLTPDLWAALLDIRTDDLHSQCDNSTALLTAIRSGLKESAYLLVEQRAGPNLADAHWGVTPLMYALALGQREVVEALISAGADVNAVDGFGNPVVKYAFATVTDINIYDTIANACSEQNDLQFLGTAEMLELLVEAGADMKAADVRGNNTALHYCCGLGNTVLHIGGKMCSITSAAYVDESALPLSSICDAMYMLLTRSNANVNGANATGCVPMHIAAARGHLELMTLLHELGAAPNAIDGEGFLPAHYTAACCPLRVSHALELAFQLGGNAATKAHAFDSSRPQNDADSKRTYDVDLLLDDIFREATNPLCIEEMRCSATELATSVTSEAFSILHLLLCGHMLQPANCNALICNEGGADNVKFRRIDASIKLLTHFHHDAKLSQSLIKSVSTSGLSTIHAAALLLQGNTPRTELTDAQKRSKRVKSYESAELHLLDLLSGVSTETSLAICTQKVGSCDALGSAWTSLHAAVAAGNTDLIRAFLSQNASFVEAILPELIDIVLHDQTSIDFEIVQELISVAPMVVNDTHQNLLEMACSRGKLAMVQAVLHNPRMQVNAVGNDDYTCIYRATQDYINENKSADVINRVKRDIFYAFEAAASRLDLAAGCGNAIDLAVSALDDDVLKCLLRWRRNDVLEKICMARNQNGRTILMELEEGNMDLVHSIEGKAASACRVNEAEEISGNEGVAEAKEQEETHIQGLSPELREAALDSLSKSNAFLNTLMDADLSFLDPDAHAHPCFSQRQLYFFR